MKNAEENDISNQVDGPPSQSPSIGKGVQATSLAQDTSLWVSDSENCLNDSSIPQYDGPLQCSPESNSEDPSRKLSVTSVDHGSVSTDTNSDEEICSNIDEPISSASSVSGCETECENRPSVTGVRSMMQACSPSARLTDMEREHSDQLKKIESIMQADMVAREKIAKLNASLNTPFKK